MPNHVSHARHSCHDSDCASEHSSASPSSTCTPLSTPRTPLELRRSTTPVTIRMRRHIQAGVNDVNDSISRAKVSLVELHENMASEVHRYVDSIHAPGLQEFQALLNIKPNLRDIVRTWQPTASKLRQQLKTFDDFLYWSSRKKTGIFVTMVIASVLVSLLFNRFNGVAAGYTTLFLGTLLIVRRAPAFQVFLKVIFAAIGVYCKSSSPFRKFRWFQEAEPDS